MQHGGSDLAHWRWFKHYRLGRLLDPKEKPSKREKLPNRPNSIVRVADLLQADGKSWDEQVVQNVCLRCDADDILKIRLPRGKLKGIK